MTKKNIFDRMLAFVEKAGNLLPHPATLFFIFALLVLLFSWLARLAGFHAINPASGEWVEVNNLLTRDGLHRIILELVTNFTSFAPLGIVLVAMLGIGIAESSGLIGTVIRLLVLSAPKRLLTFVLVFAGILSNTASDIGYVLLIPLAGTIFLAVGRHPVAGMAAAFAGVSGGFSANLILGTIDPLLTGLSEEAAHIIDPEYLVNPTANYYFMVVSTFVISISGTWVSERIVEPRLGKYEGDVLPDKIEPMNKAERKGLRYALLTLLLLIVLVAVAIIPSNGILRGSDGGLLSSPLIKGVIAFLVFFAALPGLAFGIGAGKFKDDASVVHGMTTTMKTLAAYIVLVFFAAQFVAYFRWSNLGLIIAIKGAEGLSASGLGLIPMMLLFIILSASLNMLMGSASAKWALLAPIFIPMFMLMGYSPELSQAVYRVGDSVTNIISPMMSFFALIIVFIQKYDSRAGIGTIISTMLPYSIIFFLVWTVLLIAWLMLGLPLGPGAGIYYGN
ncbi:MAG: AbgT family transporter [Bacteroidales bacterium]|nr:AbgT family transporter [Bacteroidales bacterium]